MTSPMTNGSPTSGSARTFACRTPETFLRRESPRSRIRTRSQHPRVPLWLKLSYTAFMLILVPVYWANYGSIQFLYFGDAALFLTLFALWDENALAVSMAAVGVTLLQMFWCMDFAAGLIGFKLIGVTAYMFDENLSPFLRGLSLFNAWLPCLLVYLMHRLGYDRRALAAWTGLAVALCLVAYCVLPPAGADLLDPHHARNLNYVFGLNDDQAQTGLPQLPYLCVWMAALFVVMFLPAHLVFRKLIRRQLAVGVGSCR